MLNPYASDLMRNATLEIAVRVRRTWRLRLGLWLIRLATRVIGCGLEVTTEDEPSRTHQRGGGIK